MSDRTRRIEEAANALLEAIGDEDRYELWQIEPEVKRLVEALKPDPMTVPLEDLILDSPGARTSDPYTSKEAGADQTPRKNGPRHAFVLLFLDAHPDSTDDDIHEAMGGAYSTPGKRRGELRDAGLVEMTGEGKTPFGKKAIRWSLSDLGMRYVRDNYQTLVDLRDRKRS
jgi:hypothetical protein